MMKNKMPFQAGLMLQLLVLFSLTFVGFAAAAEQQGEPNDVSHGTGPSVQGEELTLFNFVGHIKQDGPTLVAYGYLTHIYGLNDADLFTGTFPFVTEADARYTFVTNGAFEARFIVGDGNPGNTIFNIVASVSTTYYFRDQPAGGCVGPPSATCLEDPSPFESGTPIATAAGRDSDVNNVQSPNKGVLSGSSEVMLLTTPSKRAGHAPLPLWKPGVKVRITYVGEATRTDPNGPKSYSLIVGQGTVIR